MYKVGRYVTSGTIVETAPSTRNNSVQESELAQGLHLPLQRSLSISHPPLLCGISLSDVA